MPNRRQFVKAVAAATAGTFVMGRGYALAQRGGRGAAAAPAGPVTRRAISIGGKRIKVIDSHAHLGIPAVADVVKGTPFARNVNVAANLVVGADRVRDMDAVGIDVALLTQQGAWWFGVPDRDLARAIVKAQNEGTAAVVAAHPDRFIGMASMPLQFPDLAAEALEDGVKRLGFKGGGISAGWAGAKNLAGPEYDVFWSKAQELGVLLFMHPGGQTGADDPHFSGKGALGNTIGNPLETTIFLSHLIYEGTLDKFPGLHICAAHAGGYLPSYMGRTDAQCARGGDEVCGPKKRPVAEYFKTQLMADCMIFRGDGLRHMVAEMGAGQIVFGTDMPFGWPVTPDFVLNATFLNNAQKEQILGGNLIKLLKIAPTATN
jgi:aminocarboxymuconate-semialdehyde decarboxylase